MFGESFEWRAETVTFAWSVLERIDDGVAAAGVSSLRCVFGLNWRMRPLVFSFAPRSHDAYGFAK